MFVGGLKSVRCPSVLERCSSYRDYRKIPKISPGAYIFQRPFWRGLSTEGNLCFEIDWTIFIVGSKFTVFTLFYFVFWGQFSKYKPPGGLYLEGRFYGGFFVLQVWGAFIWSVLYMDGLIFGILRYIYSKMAEMRSRDQHKVSVLEKCLS